MSYPYDELDAIGTGAEDRDWTMRALQALALATLGLRGGRATAERHVAFLERLVEDIEAYAQAFCLSGFGDQDDAAFIWTTTQRNLRSLATEHANLLPLLTSRRNTLEVEAAVSVLTDMDDVDAFLVNGPMWIRWVKGLMLRLLVMFSRLVASIARALRDALARANVEPDLDEQRTHERAPPRKSSRAHRRSRVAFGLSAQSGKEGEHASSLLILTAA